MEVLPKSLNQIRYLHFKTWDGVFTKEDCKKKFKFKNFFQKFLILGIITKWLMEKLVYLKEYLNVMDLKRLRIKIGQFCGAMGV